MHSPPRGQASSSRLSCLIYLGIRISTNSQIFGEFTRASSRVPAAATCRVLSAPARHTSPFSLSQHDMWHLVNTYSTSPALFSSYQTPPRQQRTSAPPISSRHLVPPSRLKVDQSSLRLGNLHEEISQWPPTTIIMIDSKTHTIMVEACDFCGESFHPTYACPYHPRYGNHHSSSYASPQPDFCMSRPSPRSPQQERRTIKDMEKDMISDWLSPSTKKYSFDGWSNSPYQQDTYSSMRNQPSRDIIRFLLDTEQDMNLTEQELDQWIEQRDQEAEEEINSILQKISAETMSAIPLESVEMNEATPIEDDWSEPEEIIEVSLHEPDISIAQNEADEAEKEIDVILERPEEPQKRNKEDQPLVLVTPPTLLCLPVKFIKGVVIKERSQIFYTADTFVSDDHDLIDSYVLEVPDELLHLKEGMYDELPKAIDAPFVVDISKGEGIT
ncbi:hypothetical protein Sjap_018711 [Stephania japonica]|uniref:C2H2-type domain-containing protein n=1 Tax=Stephania japonica TaxID=461633 RepID=A0AAP0NNI1_9MAGN